MVEVFLRGLHEEPADETAWLALADWLEERADPRAELVRLQRQLRRLPLGPGCRDLEERVQALLASGVRPCVPVLTNAIGMELALIPSGAFLMGSPQDEKDRGKDEKQHAVAISRPFYLGVYPVTQAEYQKVMGKNPSFFSATGGGQDRVKGLEASRFPVENVSWASARKFCAKLSALAEEKRRERLYRLPTEAEWEYSCRGGASSSTPFYFGASLSSRQANFNGNYPCGGAANGPYLGRTTEVGSYKPNAWGLFDMHGNVWEWCQDWHGPYDKANKQDPQGPDKGTSRVLRGGSWVGYGGVCRSAFRYWFVPGGRGVSIGFRVVLLCGATTP